MTPGEVVTYNHQGDLLPGTFFYLPNGQLARIGHADHIFRSPVFPLGMKWHLVDELLGQQLMVSVDPRTGLP